jgi:hypothetical protein
LFEVRDGLQPEVARNYIMLGRSTSIAAIPWINAVSIFHGDIKRLSNRKSRESAYPQLLGDAV